MTSPVWRGSDVLPEGEVIDHVSRRPQGREAEEPDDQRLGADEADPHRATDQDQAEGHDGLRGRRPC